MNLQLKDLIDCMQKGWKQLPRNPTDGSSYGGSESHPTSACPLVHALLGKTGKVSFYGDALDTFPFLTEQKIKFQSGSTIELYCTILHLADVDRWSTPQVIQWLKSHLND